MSFNAKVVNGALNMRKSCSTSATRVVQIPNGSTITVEPTSNSDAWFAATYASYTGYVMAKYVQVTSGLGKCTVATAHTAYQTPSTSGSSAFSATAGMELVIVDNTSNTNWYRVSGAEGTGWSQVTKLNISSSANTPDAYGVVRTSKYGSDCYLFKTAEMGSVSEDTYFVIPNGVTLPLWVVDSYNYNFRTEYNGYTGYVTLNNIVIVDSMTTNLSQGANNLMVTKYKDILNNLGYYPHQFASYFDGAMEVALKLFQSKNGLDADGIIGTNTRAALNSSSAVAWSDSAVTSWHNGEKGTLPPKQWFMGDDYWKNFPWPSETYGNETVGDSGNSITAMAMVLTTFSSRAVTPAEMAEYTLANGYRDQSGNTGVTEEFFTEIDSYGDIMYERYTTDLVEIQEHLASGGLAIARVTADSNQTYTGGATHLVIYKINNTGVYVLSPNANKNPSTPLAYDEWDGASWFKRAYLFTEVHG